MHMTSAKSGVPGAASAEGFPASMDSSCGTQSPVQAAYSFGQIACSSSILGCPPPTPSSGPPPPPPPSSLFMLLSMAPHSGVIALLKNVAVSVRRQCLCRRLVCACVGLRVEGVFVESVGHAQDLAARRRRLAAGEVSTLHLAHGVAAPTLHAEQVDEAVEVRHGARRTCVGERAERHAAAAGLVRLHRAHRRQTFL